MTAFVLMATLATANLLCIYALFKRIRLLRERQSQINEKLLQSNKLSALGEIVTGIAHEINNPLAIIYQEVQWIQHCVSSEDPDSLKEVKDSVQEISRQIQRRDKR
jgi:two-component system NtrC family sensor kinase